MRGSSGLRRQVAERLAFRAWTNRLLCGGSRPCAGASVSALTAIPLSAPRTQRAGFPHPALVQEHAFAHAKLRFRTFRRAKPQSADSLAFRKRTGLPDCTLCFRFPFVRETPRKFRLQRKDRHRRSRLTGRFSFAPTGICLPKGIEDSLCGSRNLRSPPDCPEPGSRNSRSPGVRSAARLGRFRSGLRWPTHADFAWPRVEGQ